MTLLEYIESKGNKNKLFVYSEVVSACVEISKDKLYALIGDDDLYDYNTIFRIKESRIEIYEAR